MVIFRPVPSTTLTRADVKQVMDQLRDTSDRFEDKLEHAWFAAMGPNQRHVVQRWADDLKSATGQLLDEYKDRDAREFQFKLEETLMLAAGLNRALLNSPVSAAPEIEWNQLCMELNTLAGRFRYPVLAQTPRA